MTQRELFGDREPYEPTPALARRTDPATSHEAADKLRRSGKLAQQQTQVLLALAEQRISVTSAELAEYSKLDRYVVARRLPELCRRGWIFRQPARICQMTGNRAVTWSIKREG